MHLLRAAPLVPLLAHQGVSGDEQAKCLVTSFLVFAIPGYAGLLPSSGAGYTWAIAFEAWFYIAITWFGVHAARDAAGGRVNKSFVVEFTCMYVPIAVTTLLAVWGVYWLIVWLLREQLAEWSWSHSQVMQNLRNLNTDLFGVTTLAAHVAANSIIYYRLAAWLRRVQRAKSDA